MEALQVGQLLGRGRGQPPATRCMAAVQFLVLRTAVPLRPWTIDAEHVARLPRK
jgi:hypothetical protein